MPLESTIESGFSGSYIRLSPFNNFYFVGIGGSFGYLSYRIQPTNEEFDFNDASSRILILNIPAFIQRYYPINNTFGFYAKVGSSVNVLWSSLANFNSMAINGKRLFDTSVNIKTFPQLGLNFGLGSTYMLKNSNFISFEVQINKNFFNVIDVDYYYYENTNNDPIQGKFKANGTHVQLALGYNFKHLFKY